MNPKLSLVIPAYNESARLGNSLKTVFAYLNQADLGAEVIVVDDGSSDDTAQVAQQAFASRGQHSNHSHSCSSESWQGIRSAHRPVCSPCSDSALF